MVSSRDRIGWYTNADEYIELSLNGAVLGRYGGVPVANGQKITGYALCDDGGLFVSRQDGQAQKLEVLALDRAKRTWIPVRLGDGNNPRGLEVLGCDGSDLITTPRRPTLRFYKLAGSAEDKK